MQNESGPESQQLRFRTHSKFPIWPSFLPGWCWRVDKDGKGNGECGIWVGLWTGVHMVMESFLENPEWGMGNGELGALGSVCVFE